ncbi:MAG: PEGA domain-containing protein [Phycisphaerae bacterium]|nr:PEGA domain-containing protein [Phycisphaerae bacterium]
MITAKYPLTVSVALSLIVLAGCVERTITVRTDPAGALVSVNDVEKGRTPVTFPFTWYGQYRVLIEHPQYETLETSRGVPAPIYQWPIIDFVCEVLLPFKFHDHHDWSFTLLPRQPVDTEQLIDRAQDLRRQAETSTDR